MLSAEKLRSVLAESAIEGREEVLAALAPIYRSYVVNIDAAPAAALLSPRLS
jgi:hypothetical protein